VRRTWLLYFVFLLSGIAGLLYEIVWNRLLLLVFGGSSYATATVLASFMTGLALGSWLFGRRADRTERPLRLYGLVEIGIGLSALLVPLFVAGGRALFLRVAPSLEGTALLLPARYLLAFLTLLLPTTLMGGTLPILARAIVRASTEVGRGVGLLYFLNTGGAVLGALLAAFVTLPFLGIRGSIAIGVGVNLAVGVAVLLLCRAPLAPRPGREADDAAHGGDERVPHAPALALFALSGFASLGYEVGWVRVLVFYLGNTIFAFAIMLAVFLTGLALGGALYSVLFARVRRSFLLFGILEIGIALSALLTIHLFGELNALIAFFVRRFGLQSWGGLLLLRLLACGTTLILPTLFIGATFPAVASALTESLRRVGREVGTAYSVNTIGAIFGSVVTGFALIPAFGVEKTLLILTAINLFIAAAALHIASRRSVLSRATAVVLVVAAVLLIASRQTERFRPVYAGAAPGQELVYYNEGATATVSVHENRIKKTKLLCINGIREVPTDYGSLQVFRLLGHIGPLLHPGARNGLSIALGGGIALGSLALHPLESITCVEICPEVTKAASLFAQENHDVLGKTNVRILYNDGRNQLLLSGRRYDVILSDATHPSSADSWMLYTRDFYNLVRSRLSSGGVFSQWLPYHGVDPDTYRTILRTFRASFPHAALFALARHSVLVGSSDPIVLDLESAQTQLGSGVVHDDLASVDLHDPVRIAAALSLLDDGFERAAGPGKTNTDLFPKNSFAEAKGHSSDTRTTSLAVARSESADPLLYCRNSESIGLSDDSLRSRIDTIRRAWELDRQALTLENAKNPGAAQQAWREALRVDPENRAIAHLFGEHFVSLAISYAQSENLDAVTTVFRALVEILPWEPDAHVRLANHLLREGRVSEAIAHYEEALRLDPENAVIRDRLRALRAEPSLEHRRRL
jgi:spermidine synthase